MGCTPHIYQGDAGYIILQICVGNNPIDMKGIELIEFTIGNLSKTWPMKVEYREDEQKFYFPVTQEETFGMDGWVEYQARIKYSTQQVTGTPTNRMNINDTLSRNII